MSIDVDTCQTVRDRMMTDQRSGIRFIVVEGRGCLTVTAGALTGPPSAGSASELPRFLPRWKRPLENQLLLNNFFFFFFVCATP